MSRITAVLIPALLLAGCAESSPTAPPEGSAPGLSASRSSEHSPELPDVPVQASSLPVVMRELDSPRGLAWGPEGALYVVEAGDGVVRGPCVPVARGENCYSGSGAVSRLRRGHQERVAHGLPSTFVQGENTVSGPQDIGFIGHGTAFVSIGWGADPALRAALGEQGAGFGHLVQLTPSGRWKSVADIAGVEGELNPDEGLLDSNPFGILVEPSRRFVADAGGNSLIEVRANGRASVVATFPKVAPPPSPPFPPFPEGDAVPTAVQRGPDGALYVSTLSGVPFFAGAASIYRVVPGHPPTLFAGGFKGITDFDFARDGSMYLVEFGSGALFFNAPGRLLHVARDGTRTVVVEGLNNPTSVLVGREGSVFITSLKPGLFNVGPIAGEGTVLRYDP